jgi:hypothetical protein
MRVREPAGVISLKRIKSCASKSQTHVWLLPRQLAGILLTGKVRIISETYRLRTTTSQGRLYGYDSAHCVVDYLIVGIRHIRFVDCCAMDEGR